MSENEITQIMVDGRLVGITGFQKALKKAAESPLKENDNAIQEILLDAIVSDNYVPASARAAYGRALLREFKTAQGIPVTPENFRGLTISILGAGCIRCVQLESDVRDVLSEMGIAAELRHVSDFKEIARYGIMGGPALVINGKVIATGFVPPKSDIRKWIMGEIASVSAVGK